MVTEERPSPVGSERPADKPAPKPARELPSPEQIAAWVGGEDLPALAHLFDQLDTLRFDALTMQVRKEELLPQHWQVISQREIPEDLDFEEVAMVRRLRDRYSGADRAAARLAALRLAWQELGGKQPTLWTVADLFAVLRRVVDLRLEVDLHDLLSVTRDVWAGMTLPRGRTQLDQLWAVLAFVRQKTKK
jgi:hypothetical protein